jgi:hypothetical protein
MTPGFWTPPLQKLYLRCTPIHWALIFLADMVEDWMRSSSTMSLPRPSYACATWHGKLELSLQENATLVAGLVYILAFSLVTSVIFFSPLVLTLSALQSYLLGRPLYSLVLVLLRSMKFCRWDPPKHYACLVRGYCWGVSGSPEHWSTRMQNMRTFGLECNSRRRRQKISKKLLTPQKLWIPLHVPSRPLL